MIANYLPAIFAPMTYTAWQLTRHPEKLKPWLRDMSPVGRGIMLVLINVVVIAIMWVAVAWWESGRFSKEDIPGVERLAAEMIAERGYTVTSSSFIIASPTKMTGIVNYSYNGGTDTLPCTAELGEGSGGPGRIILLCHPS